MKTWKFIAAIAGATDEAVYAYISQHFRYDYSTFYTAQGSFIDVVSESVVAEADSGGERGGGEYHTLKCFECP